MIALRDVRVSFRHGRFGRTKLQALDGFTLQVQRGEVTAVLGPNGCGKTTAMNTMLGLIKPDEGTVLVDGVPPVPGSPLYDRIAYLPEEPHYHLYLTVGEAVNYYASLHRRNIPKTRLTSALEQVGLSDRRDLVLRKCSKGMKQKMGIAVCLASDPELLFLDEPMRGLDPQSVRLFRDALRDMNKRGATIVLNSHILAEVEMLCTHVALVRDGKVQRHAPVDEFQTLNQERYVVQIEPVDPLPKSLQLTDVGDDVLTGSVAAEDLQVFTRAVEALGSRILSVQLSKISLEDAFLAAFDQKQPNG